MIPGYMTPNVAKKNPVVLSFTDVTAAARSTLTTTSTTPSGFDGSIIAFVSGADAQVRKNSTGTWGLSVSLQIGDILNVRMTSSASFGTPTIATITMGTIAVNWTVTTVVNPAVTFTDVNPQHLSTATITTATNPTTISVTYSAVGATVSSDNTTFASSATIAAGGTLYVKMTSSSSYGTALQATISWSGGSTTWNVTTLTNPSLSFTDFDPVAADGNYSFTSVINHSNMAIVITTSGGGGLLISPDGVVSYSTSATIPAGSTFFIAQTSSTTFATKNTGTLSWEGGLKTTTWSVTSQTNPAIAFTNQVVSISTYGESTSINHSNLTTTFSISGTSNYGISNDNTSWASTTTVIPGGILYIIQFSSGSYNTPITDTVTWLGGGSTTWTVTSQTDPAASFSNVTGALITTNYVETSLNHSNVPVTYTSSGGFISNDNFSWATTATVVAGGTLFSYQTSNGTYGSGAKSMTISYPGGSTSWTVTTQPITTGSPLNYTIPGTYSATIYFNSMTVTVKGPGGGGGGGSGSDNGGESSIGFDAQSGTDGGDSSVGSIIGHGGKGGVGGIWILSGGGNNPGASGADGTASGGNVSDTTGGGSHGGAGGTKSNSGGNNGGAGGAGGAAVSSLTSSSAGTFTIIVGPGGPGGNGTGVGATQAPSGVDGVIVLSWS